jgi:uncharacterized membrane protein YjjB (DUF3815 family)
MNLAFYLHQTVCGAIAAAGFGVLFNVGFRLLSWCAASGAVALAVRTVCLDLGLNLEGASFAAALTLGAAVQLLRRHTDVTENALDVVGCIPLVPGGFAAKAIIGLAAISTAKGSGDPQTLITAVQFTLRVLFVTGAIGSGVAIPTLLLRRRTPSPAAASGPE